VTWKLRFRNCPNRLNGEWIGDFSEIPDELTWKAEVLVHKVNWRFRNNG